MSRVFAFGTNSTMYESGGEKRIVECPALAAGFEIGGCSSKMENRVLRIAEQFDTYVGMELYENTRKLVPGDHPEISEFDGPPSVLLHEQGFSAGTVVEDVARRCWFRAMDAQEDEEAGMLVADELGWSR